MFDITQQRLTWNWSSNRRGHLKISMGAILARVPKFCVVKHHTLVPEISSCQRRTVLNLLRLKIFHGQMWHVGLTLPAISQNFWSHARYDEGFSARLSQPTACRHFAAIRRDVSQIAQQLVCIYTNLFNYGCRCNASWRTATIPLAALERAAAGFLFFCLRASIVISRRKGALASVWNSRFQRGAGWPWCAELR